MMNGRWCFRSVVVLGALALAVQSGLASAADDRVVVASKNFTESRLLAEILAQLIEAQTTLQVERRINLGGTTVVFAALEAGEVDIYPEYTGTAWSVHLRREDRVSDPFRAFFLVDRAFRERFDIVWLPPFGFDNSYALAMREDTAERLGISAISDLRDQEEALRVGFSHEFLNREDGFIGLSEMYRLQLTDLRAMEHGLSYEAIGSGELDLIDTWPTDGKLLRYPVLILEDDEGFFLPYDAAPIIRGEVLRAHPELQTVLGALAFRIDATAMRALNAAVEVEGRGFAEVAATFLRETGLVSNDAAPEVVRRTEQRLWVFLASRWRQTLQLLGEHLVLTGISVGMAIGFAIPLGLWLTRRPRLTGVFLGIAGVIQTIPSLALLAFFIPVPGLGLGARSAIAALFLYALLPILRNTVTGITEVDPRLIEAARGLGLRDRELLLRIELPLAAPTILAGIRTSTVISIGVATLAAFIGAGGLGDPIVTGLQLNDPRLILSGAIPAALLALIVDAILGRVGASLMYWK